MPEKRVELAMVGGRWRTVVAGTKQVARHRETKSPIDGGGWLAGHRDKGDRQVGYINDAAHRKHGGM